MQFFHNSFFRNYFFEKYFWKNWQTHFFKNVNISKNILTLKNFRLWKKYFPQKIFFWKRLIQLFSENYFFGFFSKSNFFQSRIFFRDVHIFEKCFWQFFQKYFPKKYFLKNELWKNCIKKFSTLTFRKTNIFWWN